MNGEGAGAVGSSILFVLDKYIKPCLYNIDCIKNLYKEDYRYLPGRKVWPSRAFVTRGGYKRTIFINILDFNFKYSKISCGYIYDFRIYTSFGFTTLFDPLNLALENFHFSLFWANFEYFKTFMDGHMSVNNVNAYL